MKRILHIVNDEKFIVDTDELFYKVPNFHHSYAVIGKKKALKNLKTLTVFHIHPVSVVLGLNLKLLKNYDAIIFHGLKGFKFNLLQKIGGNIPVGWIGWGYDYYRLINPNRKDFLLPQTRFTIGNIPRKKGNYNNFFLKLFEPSLETKLRVLKKIKFFNTVVQEDHYIFEKAIGNFIPAYLDWNYPILKEKLIKDYVPTESSQNNFLLGNSGSITNNHLDAFLRVKSSNFTDFGKVICPLSYGGNKEYNNYVVKGGEEAFAEKFESLTDFYGQEEYLKILDSCTYYFSPTIRQQAFGNILLMLYIGASVILFKENPVYRSLIEKEILVFTENDLDNNVVRKLTLEEKKKNKIIILENYSETALIAKSKNLLNSLVGV